MNPLLEGLRRTPMLWRTVQPVFAMTLHVLPPVISQTGAQQFVYPTRGQSPQQQAAFGKARAACRQGKGDTVQ